MKHRRIVLVTVIIVTAFLSGGWLLQRPASQGTSGAERARVFEEILSYVAEYYVDSLDSDDLYEMAIEGMLDRLNDPYTSYLRPKVVEELNLSTTGNYGGVGIQIDSRDGWITVVTPLANTPGERAGLVSGDQIIEVDSASTEGWSTQQAANVMRGEPGTDVILTVARAGVPEPIRFTITRARIHVNFVEEPMILAPGVGYVRITSVSETSSEELRQAVADLQAKGARSLILDLRANPGGILDQGVAIADLFLDRGEVVVEMKGRAPGASQTYRARSRQPWPRLPMVVLVNQGTASAAEIIAGALQDHDRALILGTPSFGKGSAYVMLRLPGGREALTVTTSRWYTPNGRSINRPQFRRLPSQQIARALRDSAAAAAGSTFHSDAGRVLKGGGGIRPDIELLDTLSSAEQEFFRVLGGDIPKYRDAMTRYALDLKAANAISNGDFPVSDAMLDELLSRIRQREVDMPDSVWAGGRELVAARFGYELTRYVFGRPAELRRRARADRQIGRAIELLTAAKTQAELLALAAQH